MGHFFADNISILEVDVPGILKIALKFSFRGGGGLHGDPWFQPNYYKHDMTGNQLCKFCQLYKIETVRFSVLHSMLKNRCQCFLFYHITFLFTYRIQTMNQNILPPRFSKMNRTSKARYAIKLDWIMLIGYRKYCSM